MASQLSITTDNAGNTVALVAVYTGYPAQQISRAAPALQLKTSDGFVVSDVSGICQQLARASKHADAILGAQLAQEAQVFEWLTWATAELGCITDEKLGHINSWLATRTFLAANALSLADLVVFGLVHPAVATLPGAQTDSFCNLLRWYDLIQHTVDAASIFSIVHIPLPACVPPLPPVVHNNSKADSKSTTSTSTAAPASSGADKGNNKKDKGVAAAPQQAVPSTSDNSNSSSAPAAAAAAANGGAAASPAGKQGKEGKQDTGKHKEARDKGGAATAGSKAGKEAEEARIDMLDIRVGQIVSVQQHPNANALYLEEIDVGEEKPRQVISGLVKFVPKDKMENRRVVVCCNLKPAKMRDIMSYGMVLCSSSDSHDQVDPITPPDGVPVGERITFEG
eukprot:GHRR01017194.1.p1 GENE.GHRR01017194.1~~GHRR01017194.1.p1  ORF type:complete len:396 (+),score=148.00 GHRR01017194.1:73-1260(+)